MGAIASGARGPGGLRSHAGKPLPAHRAGSPLAHGQAASRLYVRAARGRSAAGARGDFRPLTFDDRDDGAIRASPSTVSAFRAVRATRAWDRRPDRAPP